jgi:tRNA1Val (adenine37-N6)-methyltransferase
MDPELTDDAIAGHFRVWQRRRGHRYSLDDVATAEAAVRARPDARSYADLGSGIGSVLAMVAYKLPAGARMAAIEAQAISFDLLTRNAERNDISARLVHGDLRDDDLLARLGGERFELATGTPPYAIAGRASPSTDEQRTYARIEMRGGIEDYLAAASRILAPGGIFVACCDARTPERARRGSEEAGLRPIKRRDVIPRAGKKGPLFTVWTFAHEGALEIDPPLIARDENGARTQAAHDLRRFFDLPVNEREPASPGR